MWSAHVLVLLTMLVCSGEDSQLPHPARRVLVLAMLMVAKYYLLPASPIFQLLAGAAKCLEYQFHNGCLSILSECCCIYEKH